MVVGFDLLVKDKNFIINQDEKNIKENDYLRIKTRNMLQMNLRK